VHIPRATSICGFNQQAHEGAVNDLTRDIHQLPGLDVKPIGDNEVSVSLKPLSEPLRITI
jgi:hypothetical protein